ncbi:hypothetical protein EV356DRAFT_318719 [Viridothelium virens]|uniref:Uncharacterized protein n=1 Tax=Viridothelium virens TaxID=1048519 RepID=A0A6A6GYV5_VIRVR|nr:hypothetical protein EV356DRAFT_318719 [Viridothelium virens]
MMAGHRHTNTIHHNETENAGDLFIGVRRFYKSARRARAFSRFTARKARGGRREFKNLLLLKPGLCCCLDEFSRTTAKQRQLIGCGYSLLTRLVCKMRLLNSFFFATSLFGQRDVRHRILAAFDIRPSFSLILPLPMSYCSLPSLAATLQPCKPPTELSDNAKDAG